MNHERNIDSLSKDKRFFFTSLIIFVVFSICFLICELYLRNFRPQPTYSLLNALVRTATYAPGEFIPFTLKPNFKIKEPSMEYPGQLVNASSNSLGLRGPEIGLTKPQGVKRILVLGDSYTYGLYVDDKETYCWQLQSLLNQQGHQAEVINAGYADGWAPDEHYAWLINRGLELNPDIIIYGFFIGNDLETDELIWEDLDKRGLPQKVVNPNVFVDKDGVLRSRVMDNKTVGYSFIYKIPILRESHFVILLSRKIERISGFNSGDHRGWGMNPFPFILKANSDENMLRQEEKFERLVQGMAEVSRENQAQFLLLMIPVNFQVEEHFLSKLLGSDQFQVRRNYFEEIKPWLKEQNIAYIDLLKPLHDTGGKYFPRNGEVHFNAGGHRFTAEIIKTHLFRRGWI